MAGLSEDDSEKIVVFQRMPYGNVLVLRLNGDMECLTQADFERKWPEQIAVADAEGKKLTVLPPHPPIVPPTQIPALSN